MELQRLERTILTAVLTIWYDLVLQSEARSFSHIPTDFVRDIIISRTKLQISMRFLLINSKLNTYPGKIIGVCGRTLEVREIP